jgi:polyphosphate kinase
MHRNLDARVEALIQVMDPVARESLNRLLTDSMSDEREAFELDGSGMWTRRVSTPEHPLMDLQETLLRQVVAG